jgi:hypothetical protein
VQAKDDCDRISACPSRLGLVCRDPDLLSTGSNTTCSCPSGFVWGTEALGCYRPEAMVRPCVYVFVCVCVCVCVVCGSCINAGVLWDRDG